MAAERNRWLDRELWVPKSQFEDDPLSIPAGPEWTGKKSKKPKSVNHSLARNSTDRDTVYIHKALFHTLALCMLALFHTLAPRRHRRHRAQVLIQRRRPLRCLNC